MRDRPRDAIMIGDGSRPQMIERCVALNDPLPGDHRIDTSYDERPLQEARRRELRWTIMSKM